MYVPRIAAILAFIGLAGFALMMAAHANETAVAVLFYGSVVSLTLSAAIVLACAAAEITRQVRWYRHHPASK